MPIGAVSNGKSKELELETWNLPKSVGDKWTQVDNSGKVLNNWVWHVNYWLGQSEGFLFNFVGLNASCNVILPIKKDQDILVDKAIIDYTIDGTNTTTKYWSFNLFRISNTYAWTWLGNEDTKSNWYAEKEIVVNQQDILSLNNTIYYLLQITRNSNPGNLDISGQFFYNQIRN